MHDVVVVGGGPAGCYTANLLAQKGFDVHLLEEHSVIGEPVDCSGVVGAEAFTALGIPDTVKLGSIDRLTLISPSQLEIPFRPHSPLAYIVDRAGFDRAIADWTMASGVSFHLGTRVSDLRISKDCVEIHVNGQGASVNGQHSEIRQSLTVNRQSSIVNRQSLTVTRQFDGAQTDANLPMSTDELRLTSNEVGDLLRARIVILADGPRYKFQQRLGMGGPRDFLKTAQTEARVSHLSETTVLLGSEIAPGSFAWIVPFKRGETEFARIGVSAKVSPVGFLRQFLHELSAQGHLDVRDAQIRSWVIPIDPLKRTYAERVLAVGDAAGQTKPTTGGGIYYGLICAEAAAEAVAAVFRNGDFSAQALGIYQRVWRKRLGQEIRVGRFFRRLVERLKDDEIDELFRVVQSDGVLAAVTQKARFDWHKDVIYFAVRHPGLGKIFLRGLFR